MKTCIFTLTSSLHDEAKVDAASKEFLDGLGIEYALKGPDFNEYGTEGLSLIYVRTGGTEAIFKSLLPELLEKTSQPFCLLTSGKSNSLAASMEILSFLRQKGIKGEIIHGSPAFMKERILAAGQKEAIRRKLHGTLLGVIGKPSDWLISSDADYGVIESRLGITLTDIPIEELLDEIKDIREDTAEAYGACDDLLAGAAPEVRQALPGAYRIYKGFKALTERYGFDGFTVRCFDLLSSLHNTGCLALAKLNSEGIIAGCEGDIPALISMTIGKAVTGVSGFQANPSRIDPETGEIVFSHCTVPLNMVTVCRLDTHFESGIGVGIHGNIQEGPVTIFKVSGDLSRHFIMEGTLVRNEYGRDLCRTQVAVKLPDVSYFLNDPLGNHHIVLPGHCAAALQSALGE